MTPEEIKKALFRYTDTALKILMTDMAKNRLSIIDAKEYAAYVGDSAARAAVAAVKGNVEGYKEIVNQKPV